jgi:3-dehydroquinate synthetase
MPALSEARIAQLDCTRQRSFDITFARGLASGDGSALAAAITDRRVVAVSTPTVDKLYGDTLRRMLGAHCAEHRYTVLRLDERRKQLPVVQRLCQLAAEFRLDRRGAFVALGGGICSDVVTMAASMVRRGVDHIRIPTTLIGQIDAGIGIKGAVNLAGQKSFTGVFHAPAAVLIDPAFLATLPAARIRQGLSEILKMALIRDAELFELVETHVRTLLAKRFQEPGAAVSIVSRAISLMVEELARNPYEDQTFERLVDMGHTFSPQLEARSGFRITHGEAVAVDMALSCVIAVELGLMSNHAARRFIALLERVGLPVSSPLLSAELCREAMACATAHRGGSLNLVLPCAIGHATFVDNDALAHGVLERALAKLPWFAAGISLENAASLPRLREPLHASRIF